MAELVNVTAQQYATAVVQWDQPASTIEEAQAGPYIAEFDGNGQPHQVGPTIANLSSPFGCTVALKDIVGSNEPPALGTHSFTITVPGRSPVAVTLEMRGLGTPSNFRVA